MSFSWLFLFELPSPVSGTFNPTEMAMTLVVTAALVAGIVIGLRWQTATRSIVAAGVFLLFAVLQVAAMAMSLTPYIARR